MALTPPAFGSGAESVWQFGADRVAPKNRALDEHPQDLDLIRALLLEVGKIGLYGTMIPPEHGGTGPDSITLHAGLDALAYHNAGLAMSTMPTYLTARALAVHGDADQQERWLPPIARGEAIAAWAVTEPDAGSDVASIGTRAERVGEGWSITGQKIFITNASIADLMLILCRTGGGGYRDAFTTFVVPVDVDGIAVTQHLEKMGLRSSPTCAVSLDRVVVDDDCRLGDPGTGWEIAMDVLDYERIAVPAIAAGLSQRALDLSRRYAEEREAFGGPIIDIGAVQAMLADMAAGLLECRLLYRHAAELVDAGASAITEGSAAKLVGGRLATEVSSLGVQIHGGSGYIRDFEVERLYRDARLFSIGGGTSEIQRKIIAQQVRKEPDWSSRAGAPVHE
jgi:alkylation response protein AidB-like acyl-CoA dehydrogenase